MLAFLYMIAASAGLFMAGAFLRKRFEAHLPLFVLTIYTTVFFVVGVVAMWGFVGGTTDRGSGMFRFGVSLTVWIPPLYMLSQLVGGFSAARVVDSLFHHSSVHGAARSSYGRARALMLQGDMAGAKQCLLESFHENPKTPDPLFEGARILAKEQCHEEAAVMYEEIMQHFQADLAVWLKAAWHLGVLQEEHMHQPKSATETYRKIMRRAPKSEVGRLAGGRIQRNIRPEKPFQG